MRISWNAAVVILGISSRRRVRPVYRLKGSCQGRHPGRSGWPRARRAGPDAPLQRDTFEALSRGPADRRSLADGGCGRVWSQVTVRKLSKRSRPDGLAGVARTLRGRRPAAPGAGEALRQNIPVELGMQVALEVVSGRALGLAVGDHRALVEDHGRPDAARRRSVPPKCACSQAGSAAAGSPMWWMPKQWACRRLGADTVDALGRRGPDAARNVVGSHHGDARGLVQVRAEQPSSLLGATPMERQPGGFAYRLLQAQGDGPGYHGCRQG